MPNLDGLTMYVSNTAANGVVDTDTRLHFRQAGDRVREHGGRVRIIEHFEWSTRAGSGVNVFDEVVD